MSTDKEEGLMRHSTLLLVAQQVGNATTIGFAIVAGRYLSKEEYGLLIPLLNIILFMGYPMDALRTSFAHFAARLDKDNRRADIKSLLKQWSLYLCLAAAGVIVGFIVFQQPLAKTLHLDSAVPLYLVSLGIAGTFFLPMVVGSLQGIQAFGWFTIVSQSWGVLRLLFVCLLFWVVGQTAIMGLASQVLCVMGAGLLGYYSLRGILRNEAASGEKVPGVMKYAVFSFPVLVGFSVLMTFDAILARIFFPEANDMYARASQIGRSVIFFAQPVVMALFPKVASSGGTTSRNWKNLLVALLLTALLISPLIGGVLLFPQLPIIILFGSEAVTEELVRYTRLVMMGMSPLSFVFLLMNFELAQHRFRLAGVTVISALIFAGGVWLYHPAPWAIVLMLGIASLVAVLVLTAGLLVHSRKKAPAAPGP